MRIWANQIGKSLNRQISKSTTDQICVVCAALAITPTLLFSFRYIQFLLHNSSHSISICIYLWRLALFTDSTLGAVELLSARSSSALLRTNSLELVNKAIKREARIARKDVARLLTSATFIFVHTDTGVSPYPYMCVCSKLCHTYTATCRELNKDTSHVKYQFPSNFIGKCIASAPR